MSIFAKTILMTQKTCTKCGETKDITEFFKDKQKPDGCRPDCKTCNIKRSTDWQKNNKAKRHDYEMKNKYGMVHGTYQKMLQKQKGKCAICGKHENECKTRFHVDHDHTTGKIRNLLCVNCNHGIGAFFENEELLKKAVKYIKKWH